MATGNLKDARRAVMAWMTMDDKHAIGSGSYRTVYRFGRYVYKVNLTASPANELEYEAIVAGKENGIPYLPPVDLWYVDMEDREIPVICMPFYKHAAHVFFDWTRLERLLHGLPEHYTWDASGDNVRVTEGGQLRITDVAPPIRIDGSAIWR